MSRWWLFAPFCGLVILAGYLGWQFGQPVTETDIINRFAARYVGEAGAGAAVTDCLAQPSPRADVRLVVICTHPDGAVFRFPSGPRGALVPDGATPGEV